MSHSDTHANQAARARNLSHSGSALSAPFVICSSCNCRSGGGNRPQSYTLGGSMPNARASLDVELPK